MNRCSITGWRLSVSYRRFGTDGSRQDRNLRVLSRVREPGDSATSGGEELWKFTGHELAGAINDSGSLGTSRSEDLSDGNAVIGRTGAEAEGPVETEDSTETAGLLRGGMSLGFFFLVMVGGGDRRRERRR